MLNGISRLEATVVQFNTMLMMFQAIQHEANQFLYIDTSLDGILSAWISKLMTTDSPIQSGEVTIPPPNTTLGRTMVSRRFDAPEIEKNRLPLQFEKQN